MMDLQLAQRRLDAFHRFYLAMEESLRLMESAITAAGGVDAVLTTSRGDLVESQVKSLMNKFTVENLLDVMTVVDTYLTSANLKIMNQMAKQALTEKATHDEVAREEVLTWIRNGLAKAAKAEED